MRKYFVDFLVFMAGILSFVFMLNLTGGIVEIPDNLPFIGNLDEAMATTLFLTCLGYFGISGGKFVNVLRVLAGKPPLLLAESKPQDKGKEEETEKTPPPEKGA